MLLREPVLQDRRAEHVKFQKYAHELMERVSVDQSEAGISQLQPMRARYLFQVSGPARRKNYDNNDITLDMLHRASVVANTKIRYEEDERMCGIKNLFVFCFLQITHLEIYDTY